jgi:2-(3-amino-3-carboxypropyl)histidine synthase
MILLQLPEGLKNKANIFIQDLKQKYDEEIVISGSAMYGGCDIAIDEAKAIGARKIIHVGHTEFPLNRSLNGIEVEFIPYYIDIEINWPFVIEEFKLKGYKTISILTTTQHMHQYKDIEKYFLDNGFKNKVKKGPFCSHVGQVLGCDSYGAEKVDAVLIIAEGKFHWTAAVYLADITPVYGLDPFSKEFTQINDLLKKIKKIRNASIIKAVNSKNFGILVSTKPGQYGFAIANKIKQELENLGKNAYIIVANDLNPETLYNFTFIDVYINTACPRIVDDVQKYGKPILNPDGVKEMIKILKTFYKYE